MRYFIYYSATGNGDFIADKLKEIGYEPVKVETIKPLGKMGFFKMLHYGGQAMFNKKAKIKEINIILNEDDLVIIGSPIWNDRLSTPINTVLSHFDFDKEMTKFILYPAGEGTKKSLEQIEKLGFKQKPIVYSNPKKNPEQIKEIGGELF